MAERSESMRKMQKSYRQNIAGEILSDISKTDEKPWNDGLTLYHIVATIIILISTIGGSIWTSLE